MVIHTVKGHAPLTKEDSAVLMVMERPQQVVSSQRILFTASLLPLKPNWNSLKYHLLHSAALSVKPFIFFITFDTTRSIKIGR